MGLFTGTLVFLALEAVFVLWVVATTGRSGPKANLQFTLYTTAVVCCWMMWAMMYIAQSKPLIRPTFKDDD